VEKKSLRERKKEQTRVHLTRAAIDLFQEQSYDATTVEDIAEAADYSRSTFFRYFGTKEDVVFGDLPERLHRLETTLAAVPDDVDPWQVAERALRTNVQAFISGSDPDLERRCVALWFKEPALQRRYVEIVLAWETTLARYFAQARGVDFATDVVGKTVASAMVGVGRAVTEMQLAGADVVDDAMERGFKALRDGFAHLERNNSSTTKRPQAPRVQRPIRARR
jgi:AcrR family transcriptional regulator